MYDKESYDLDENVDLSISKQNDHNLFSPMKRSNKKILATYSSLTKQHIHLEMQTNLCVSGSFFARGLSQAGEI